MVPRQWSPCALSAATALCIYACLLVRKLACEPASLDVTVALPSLCVMVSLFACNVVETTLPTVPLLTF